MSGQICNSVSVCNLWNSSVSMPVSINFIIFQISFRLIYLYMCLQYLFHDKISYCFLLYFLFDMESVIKVEFVYTKRTAEAILFSISYIRISSLRFPKTLNFRLRLHRQQSQSQKSFFFVLFKILMSDYILTLQVQNHL